MKQLLFGNPHTDSLEFSLDAISAEEACITAEAQLKASWFSALLPLVIRPKHLEEFLSQLADLDRTLKGVAVLKSTGQNGPIEIFMESLPRGHINCRIEADLDGNSLKCHFRSDQTQLRPLHTWWEKVLAKYRSQLPDE
jgi:hypothetical protein